MSSSQYEREREETLRRNRMKLEELFGSSTPAADMRQKLQELQTEDDTTSKDDTIKTRQDIRRSNNRLFTCKEVDAMEGLDNSQSTKRKKPQFPPPTMTTRYVFDHVFISRRTSRLAARETTEKIKDALKIISSKSPFPTTASEDISYQIKKKQMPPKTRQRQAELLQAGRVNHCHLCAKERSLGWIPCAKCEQRFHYDCLKKWFNLNTNEYDLGWKCPICREFCNCTECSKNNWGRSNEKRGSGLMLTRNGSRSGLRSSGTNPLSNTSSSAKRGDDSGGDKVYADQKGLGNGSLRQGQQQQRSRNLARWMTDDYGDDDLKTERSTRSQPSRAAVRMAKGRLRKEVSFNDDEDVFVTSETMTKPKKAVTKTEDKDDNDGYNDDGSGGIYVDEGEADVSGEDLDEDHEVDRGLSSKRKRMAQY